AGASLLTQTKVNPANHFALLVQVLEGGFHFAIQQHPSVNLEALLLIQILRFADRWNRRAQVPGHFIGNVVSLLDLADAESCLLQPKVGNAVSSLRGARRTRGKLGLATTVGTVTRGGLGNCLFLFGHPIVTPTMGLRRILTRITELTKLQGCGYRGI